MTNQLIRNVKGKRYREVDPMKQTPHPYHTSGYSGVLQILTKFLAPIDSSLNFPLNDISRSDQFCRAWHFLEISAFQSTLMH